MKSKSPLQVGQIVFYQFFYNLQKKVTSYVFIEGKDSTTGIFCFSEEFEKIRPMRIELEYDEVFLTPKEAVLNAISRVEDSLKILKEKLNDYN